MTGIFCLDELNEDFLKLVETTDFIEEKDDFTMISNDQSAAEHISHIDRLYFFPNIKNNTDNGNFDTIEQWENFCRTKGINNIFIFSSFGEIRQGSRLYKYVFLERLSGGNPVLRNELTRMIKEYRLTELALSGARDNVKSYIKECPYEADIEGFLPPEALEYHIQDCRYSIYDNCTSDSIAVKVEMRNRDGIIGYYTMLFDSENGVICDDIFYEPF